MYNLIKTLESVDHCEILEYYENIKNSIVWEDFTKCKQSSLQHKNNQNVWTSGTGPGDGTDLEYKQLNSFYENSIFEKLIQKFNLYRTRLMLVEPWSCYSMHCDTTPRIHIPIITNPNSYFVFKEGLIQHLPTGYAYWVDTMKTHTFMNCSREYRVHLMGSVKE